MRILLINPNTNESMTKSALETALLCKEPRTEITAVTNTCGPLSIEGFFDEVLSTSSVLALMAKEQSAYDAFIIACYSAHPAVIAGRELTTKPVVGIMEASLLLASLICHRFAVITTSARWEPLLWEGVRQVGLESRCAAVLSSGLAVLDLEAKSPEEVREILMEKSRQAIVENGAEAICLGCAGMAGLSEKLEQELRVPVIDPIGAAVKMAEALIYQGLYTSKIGAFQPIEPRESKNLPETLAKVYQA